MRKYVSRSVIVALFVGIAWVSYFAYANIGIDCPTQSSCGPYGTCAVKGNNKECETTYTIENLAAGQVCTSTGGTKTVCAHSGAPRVLCGKKFSCTFVAAPTNYCEPGADPYAMVYTYPLTCY